MNNTPSPGYTLEDYDRTVAYIRSRIAHTPTIGLVLGSGLGALAEQIEDAVSIPYPELPQWPRSTVIGHSSKLVIGILEGQHILVMQGRSHFYEGYGMDTVTYPIRVMQRLGIHTLIVTNAAGGVDPAYQPGDIMLIQDHLNMPGMAGHNPLRGPNNEHFGTRFPDMSNAYDRDLRRLTRTIAAEEGIAIHEGVYACVAGPSFETPAEIRMLRLMGAHAVGMSTAPEVVVANHAGMRVLGFSGISNSCATDPDIESLTSHEEVLEAGKTLVPKLVTLIRAVLRKMQP